MSPAMPTVERGSAVDVVYAVLCRQIVDGVVPPGEKVNIDGVARELGVSQTPVREALQRLESDDLLVYERGRGYSTTPIIDNDTLRDVFEFRLLVEPFAARSAANEGLANPDLELADEIERFEAAVAAGDDVRQAMLSHDTRFHDLIMAAAGNQVVRRAFAQTHCHLHVFRLQRVDPSGEETLAEHRRIAERIAANDPAGAGAAMTEHIKLSFRRSSAGLAVAPSDLISAVAGG